jgi:hypothetical protein
MGAAVSLAEEECITLASGFPVPKAPDRAQYALAADAPRVSKLVYDGPRLRMQVVLDGGARRYFLRGVFVVEFAHDGDSVFASSRGLPVSGIGADDLGALEDFCASFDFQFRNLVDVDPATLTAGGRRRREAMSGAVERVEAIEPPNRIEVK